VTPISSSDNKPALSAGLGLFIASFSSLFFELLIIRWLSCDFVSFGVFKTFPLVTCFVGLGTGVAKASDKNFKTLPIALLTTVIATLVTSYAGYGEIPFPSASLYQWTAISGIGAQQLFTDVLKGTALVILLLMGPFAVMFCIGTLIGTFFNKLEPLKAYCIDIGGAIAGSITFAILSLFFVSPNLEVVLLAVIFAYLAYRTKQATKLGYLALIATVVTVMLPIFNPPSTIWTPYYRIDVADIALPAKFNKTGENQNIGILVNTNKGFSQSFTKTNEIELSPEGEKIEAARYLKSFLGVRKNYYALPYSFIAPKTVLILGAGSGSDVAEAVKRGATDIDAVEIDPGTLGLAKKYNPYFNNPAVHYHLDDGRRFLSKTKKKYDLIILACLDSRAVSGSGSSLRTDCYIHTRDSYEQCAKLLNENGLMSLSFGASVDGNSDWLRNRIYRTLESVTGYPPVVISDEKAPVKWPAYFFITGQPVKAGLIHAPVNPDSFTGETVPQNASGIILSDDWPFLYVREKNLDLPYIFVLALVLLTTFWVGRSLIFSKKTGSDWQLLSLGAAFILVELQAITRLSLLYGATWVTSSVVINGVLVMILAANYLTIKSKTPFNQNVLYAALFASLLASYFLPCNSILSNLAGNEYLAMAIITATTLIPILMAGLIFATAFKSVKQPSRSFAFNLIGSVFGGLLEYLSTYIGINALVMVSLGIYVLSFLAMRKASSETQ
jgi:hypothetical protein